MSQNERLHIVLLGAPGAGKGTQAVTLSRELGLAHISSGDLFRKEQSSGSELGRLAKSYMEKGQLVPDEVTIKMILGRISAPDCARGFILDGFPRTMEQARSLDGALAAGGRNIDMALYIKVSDRELLRRLSARWLCGKCQSPYNLIDLPPKAPGRCDGCGGELYQRADDTAETAKKRLEVYFAQTQPLIDFYDKAGKLVRVDGEQEVKSVFAEMVSAISRHRDRQKQWTSQENKDIIAKSPQQIKLMREAGRIVARVLEVTSRAVKPGVTTGVLDALAAETIGKMGGKPSFKGYRGFPANICTSLNEEVVHGIPGGRALKEGDIVSIDAGAIFEGFQADGAVTVGVGNIGAEAKALVLATENALMSGIAAARIGARVGDISAAVQSAAESRGFSVVREYVGHGIGRDMHEEPHVPNFGVGGQGPLLRKGMTLALEPMLNAGGWQTRITANKWTVVTADGRLSAHFEHTIAITDDGAEILTKK